MKTYITTYDHPFLKQGIKVEQVQACGTWLIYHDTKEKTYSVLHRGFLPEDCSRWYKEERWRAEEGGRYWFVDNDGKLKLEEEEKGKFDTNTWEAGNYYRTEEEAEAAAVRVKQAYKE